MTTILPNGQIVLANQNGNAKVYGNRAAAQARVDALGAGWKVREPSLFARGFMVARVAADA